MKNIIEHIEDKDIIFYLEYLKYERRLSYNTIDSYGENLKLLSDTYNKNIIDLTTDDIRKFLDNMDVSPRSKTHYLTVFNSFYTYMIFQERITINPCDGIRHPKLDKKLPNY